MARWTKYLTNLLPRTGRIIRESGDSFNEADFLEVKTREEVSSQSLLGNAYIASFRRSIPAGQSVDLVLQIPAGTRVYFHRRGQTIVGGQLEWQIRRNPSPGFTAAETIKGNNLDSDIAAQSQASIIRTTAATTGSTFGHEGILYPPGSGTNQSTAASSSADAIPQYTQTSQPVLRLTNTGAGAMLIVVSFIWAEEAIV